MLSFTKRVKSPEMDTRRYDGLKSIIQSPSTKVNTRMENGETIFTLSSEDGRVHEITIKVNALPRKKITLKLKEARPDDGIVWKKRTFKKRTPNL